MAYSRSVLKLDDKIDRSTSEDVRIRSLIQGRQPCKQLRSSLQEIEKEVLVDAEISVFPRTYACEGDVLDDLKDRMKELSADGQVGLAYIGTSLAVSANIHIDHTRPDSVLFDVVLIRHKHPTICFSIVGSSVKTLKDAKRYNACLSKGVTKSIRAFTSETFVTVHGVLSEVDLKLKSDFKTKLDTIVKDTSRLCIPDALTMSCEKYQIVVRAFLSSVAAVTFVEFDDHDESRDTTWFLTLQQFCILTENIDRHDVHVCAVPSSGGSVLSLAVVERLQKLGRTLLIADDTKLVRLAEKKNFRVVEAGLFSAKTSEHAIDGVMNVVISGKADIFKRIRCQLPEMKSLWIFERLSQVASSVANIVDVQRDVSKHTKGRSTYGESSPVAPSVANIVDVQRDVSKHTKGESSPEQHGLKPFTVDVARVRIEERTSQEIQEMCRHALKTSLFRQSLDRLQQRGIIILVGSPGDGKTTIGYQILEELKVRGYSPLRIKSPEEYFSAVTFEREAIFLESIFGFETYDRTLYSRWLGVLSDIKPQIRHGQNKAFFIITSRDYIFREAQQNSGEVPSSLHVFNISTESAMCSEERRDIIQYKEKLYGIYLNEDDVDDVSNSSLPFGFPFSCDEFFLSEQTPGTFRTHMNNHISFLISVIQGLFADESKRHLLTQLVKYRGKLDLKLMFEELAAEGTFRQQSNIRRQADILTGVILWRNGTVYKFAHKAIHIAVAAVLGINDPELCIRYAKLSVLDKLIQSGLLHSLHDEMTVQGTLVSVLADRLRESIQLGKIFETLSMKVFSDPTLVAEMFGKLSSDNATNLLLNKKDTKRQEPFTYFLSANEGVILLKTILSKAWLCITLDHLCHILRGCCEFGNVPALEIILSRCPNLVSELTDALHMCAKTDNWDICKLLLKHGTKLPAIDEEENTPIHTCASNGSINTLKVLIEVSEGGLLNRVNRDRKTALHLAIENRHDDISAILIEQTDCEIQDRSGRTALHIACQNGMHGIVVSLLKKTENSLLHDNDGNTALHAAASGGDLRILCEILTVAEKNDINTGNNREIKPLQMLPPFQCAVQCYELLLRSGADPHVTDEGGNTVLHCYAEQKGSVLMVKKLLTQQKCLKDKQNKCGKTPLHLAATHGDAEIVQSLLDAGADPLLEDKSGFTPLTFASCEGHLPVVKLLCRPLPSAVSAFHQSASNGHSNIVECLLDAGCDVDMRNSEGCTALHIATEHGHLNVVQTLIERGCSINAKSIGSITALHIAATMNHVAIAEELLNHGIDMFIENSEGKVAMECAEEDMLLRLSLLESIRKKSCKKTAIKGNIMNIL